MTQEHSCAAIIEILFQNSLAITMTSTQNTVGLNICTNVIIMMHIWKEIDKLHLLVRDDLFERQTQKTTKKK